MRGRQRTEETPADPVERGTAEVRERAATGGEGREVAERGAAERKEARNAAAGGQVDLWGQEGESGWAWR